MQKLHDLCRFAPDDRIVKEFLAERCIQPDRLRGIGCLREKHDVTWLPGHPEFTRLQPSFHL